jgi:hypothetical protein
MILQRLGFRGDHLANDKPELPEAAVVAAVIKVSHSLPMLSFAFSPVTYSNIFKSTAHELLRTASLS